MSATGRPPPSLALLLALTARRVAESTDAALGAAGLTRRHLGALGHLAREPGLSLSEVARRARITPQSMHATMGELERDGLVTRSETGRGRRAGLVVTTAGRARLESGMSAIATVDDDLRARVGADAYDATVLALLAVLDADGAPPEEA